MLDTVGVVVDRTAGHAVLIDGDLAHPASCAQLHATPDRIGPIGYVGTAFGALRTTTGTWPKVKTAVAAHVGLGNDGTVRRPPMPTQLVEAARHGLTR